MKRRMILTAACGGIFALLFYLYSIPVKAALYPTVLSGLLLMAVSGAELVQERKKRRTLEQLSKLPDELLYELERFNSPLEQSYRDIIEALLAREASKEAAWVQDSTDRMDYYTTWVHQIKTPISSMHLMLQEEDSSLSRRLSEELMRIEQYVQMALTYQRLGSSSTDYVFRSCDVDAIVRGCLRKYAGQFISRGIRLVYTPTEYRVVTDEKWLAFVIEQVLSNALKYTPSGSICVSMEGTRLAIRDTGIGIEAEDLPRIFEKGYTGTNGRRDKKASGLGLYLCRRICTELGHGLSAESTPGVGTAVFLELSQQEANAE